MGASGLSAKIIDSEISAFTEAVGKEMTILEYRRSSGCGRSGPSSTTPSADRAAGRLGLGDNPPAGSGAGPAYNNVAELDAWRRA
ncbi:hypothetical protein [Brucella microti]|uniref:hypothetical protein n=1 Tax=Brucella microti TaxID=444163 RepID=UPI0026BF4F7A